MRYFIMGDLGGGSDDFVDSITLFSVKDIDDLKEQVLIELEEYYYPMAEQGIFQFIECDSLEQAEYHIDFFHKDVREHETDCWRHSVDLPMLKAHEEDILTQKDFTLSLLEIT